MACLDRAASRRRGTREARAPAMEATEEVQEVRAAPTKADEAFSRAIVDKDLENLLYLDLSYGRLVIEMRPDLAPNHVARVKELVRQKF